MSQPVFVNEKMYPVQVSTPSGAGRIINTGFAVEGDYFVYSYRNGLPLRLLTEEEAKKFDRKKILATITLEAKEIQQEAKAPAGAEGQAEPIRFEPPVETPEQRKETERKRGRRSNADKLAESINEAFGGTSGPIPTKAELQKMSTEALSSFASRFNLRADNREVLIDAIVRKLPTTGA